MSRSTYLTASSFSCFASMLQLTCAGDQEVSKWPSALLVPRREQGDIHGGLESAQEFTRHGGNDANVL